jgi:integrase
MRRGAAARAQGVPLDDGEIFVARSWSATRTGAYMREMAKVSKARPLSLVPEAVAALRMHGARYLEELVEKRSAWEALREAEPKFRDLVFPSAAGTPLDHTNVNRQRLKPILGRAGLPPMRPYDLRHSFATLWIEAGESGEHLQKILGHSSIATTDNTYPQLSPRHIKESFGRFGNVLGGR